MSNAPSLSNIIKQLKAELLAADKYSSDTGLTLSKAQVSLGFSTTSNESGDVLFTYHDNQEPTHSSKLTLTFSRSKESSLHPNFELIEDDLDANDRPENDDFESFKKRFQANVKLKHGKSSIKKKNVFDCD